MDDNEIIFKELQHGTRLNGGKYVILEKIGEGGFSITYKAIQDGLNRLVCIKEYFLAGYCIRNTRAHTINLQGISDDTYEKYRQAFVKEAQTLAALHHPNIVEVIDIFDENRTSYMVMPFIEGNSLQKIVEVSGPLSYPKAVNFMGQVTEAVGYIHQQGILHRDIKPDNIMITADYKAILIDFGSAREFQQDKTQQHTAMLTHGYAPPEQYTMNSRKGTYTDIYAIGATLYFILTGKVPIEAAARTMEPLIEPIKINPDIPKEANRTIMKAMQLKTADRYQSVRDLMNDLVPGGLDPQPTRKPRSKWLVGILIAIVVILGGAIGLNMMTHHDKVEQKEIEKNIRNHRIDSLHNEAVKKLDIHLNMINIEDNYTDKDHVIEALMVLKTIENIEGGEPFKQLGKQPCYQEKFRAFIEKVKAEQAAIAIEIAEYEKDGMTGKTYMDLKEKQSLNQRIIDQAQEGSAVKIDIKKQ